MLNKIDVLVQPLSQAGSTGGAPADKAVGTNRAAWLREMEKQEMASWLGQDAPPQPKYEPSLFRQSAQAIVAAGGARADTRQVPSAHAMVTAQVSQPLSVAAANTASAALPHAVAPLQAATAAVAGALSPMAVPGGSPLGFAEYVVSQLGQPMASAATLTAAPADAPAAQPAQYGRPAFAALASVGAGVEQDSVEPVVPDEKDEVAARPAVAAPPRGDGETSPAVRVHAFWSDQSVRIWVGTNSSGALDAQQLALAAQDVRRLLRQQGATLESLTVNGETVVAQDEGRTDTSDGAPAATPALARTTVRPAGQA